MKRQPPLNRIAKRSRAYLLHTELLRQARAAQRSNCEPENLRRLMDCFPLVAGLLGAARAAMQMVPTQCVESGVFYLGNFYRIEALEGGAFRVLALLTREPLVQSPPGAV